MIGAAIIASVAAASMQSSSGILAGRTWDPWDYGTASICVLRSLGTGGNEAITAALRQGSLADLQPIYDSCAKKAGLADRPYERPQLLIAMVASKYADAARCAVPALPSWDAAALDRETAREKADPENYELPKDVMLAISSCNSELFHWAPKQRYVREQILRTVRYARKWKDQLSNSKADPKLRTPEGELALCIVERIRMRRSD